MRPWVKMPSDWLRLKSDPPLASLRWNGVRKADQIAALMTYVVLVHHANNDPTSEFQELGYSRLTYDRLSEITGLSRAKISGGIEVLKDLQVVNVSLAGRGNVYHVTNYGQTRGWAKLPARGLYTKDLQRIRVFHLFKLRMKAELSALKLYLLVLALRDNKSNYATMSYDTIGLYTGVDRNDVRTALSLLIGYNLVHVDQRIEEANDYRTINMYRPCNLDPYRHRATTERGVDELLIAS